MASITSTGGPEQAQQELQTNLSSTPAPEERRERRRSRHAFFMADEGEADTKGAMLQSVCKKGGGAGGALVPLLRRRNGGLGPRLANLRGGPGWH
jgi:hypothetical protein